MYSKSTYRGAIGVRVSKGLVLTVNINGKTSIHLKNLLKNVKLKENYTKCNSDVIVYCEIPYNICYASEALTFALNILESITRISLNSDCKRQVPIIYRIRGSILFSSYGLTLRDKDKYILITTLYFKNWSSIEDNPIFRDYCELVSLFNSRLTAIVKRRYLLKFLEELGESVDLENTVISELSDKPYIIYYD